MIAIDGVLRADTGAPIVEGLVLYRALFAHRVVLVTEDSRESAEYWLKLEKLTHHTMLLTSDVAAREADVRAGQLRYSAGLGNRIEMLIDPSPVRCAAAMGQGITALLFSAPKYQRPEWRPDAHRGMRPWAEISGELDKQAIAIAEDSRL